MLDSLDIRCVTFNTGTDTFDFLTVTLRSSLMINVFAYGSNMCTERIQARVGSATPVAVGYVTQRQLVFHKRGVDGSAKADAVFTGCDEDRVWGVVFSVKREHKPLLDGYERGYVHADVVVHCRCGSLTACIYTARSDAIDASLKPFSWYHGFVLHGALQHRLPRAYVERLQAFEFITDPDAVRHDQNSQRLLPHDHLLRI